MAKKECCGTCKYHHCENEDNEYMCANEYSDYYTDWTEYEDYCDGWEERE